MAVLVDDVAACTVGTRAFVKASVDFHLSFYSHAKINVCLVVVLVTCYSFGPVLYELF